jgi:type IV secretion system protein VirB6
MKIINFALRLSALFIVIWVKPVFAAWYDDNYSSATSSSLYGCYTLPTFHNTHSESISINYNNNNWVDSGISVEAGKLLQIKWDTLNDINNAQSRKYRVLFKADPRFARSQVMIARFDNIQNKYIWDFDEYRNGYFKSPTASNALSNFTCNSLNSPDCNARNTYYSNINDYINFIEREKLIIRNGEVANITLLQPNEFFTNGLSKINEAPDLINRSDFGDELPRFTLHSEVGNLNNGILYYDSQIPYSVGDSDDYNNRLNMILGKATDSSLVSGLPNCSDNSSGITSSACLYDKGRGMNIMAGGNFVKDGDSIFLMHNNRYMYYYKANSDTFLDFAEHFSKNGIFSFTNANHYLECLVHAKSNGTDRCNFDVNYLYLGRYLMEIEIGSGLSGLKTTHNPHIKFEYFISDTPPTPSTAGTILDTNFYKTDAGTTGRLWFRVIDTNPSSDITGRVIAHYVGYNGSNDLSKFIMDYLVDPLREKFTSLSRQLYFAISEDPAFTRVARLMLTLYVVFYGLYFLAGGVQISVQDLVGRVVKIAVILTLLSEQSWNFFNDNLFKLFFGGMDYLIINVIGYSSSSTNIFGFIDPIFTRYLQPEFWAMIGIYLVHLHNGLFLIAILILMGTITYISAILEIVINYIIAMLALCVLFSIAPIFIVMILFSQTRHLFENWISLLFSYAVQPTVLLLMILIVDQVIAEQLTKVVLPACWGLFMEFNIRIDLDNIIPGFIIEFVPPGVPGIPFFVVDLNSSVQMEGFEQSGRSYYNVLNSTFIFFIFAKMSKGMMDFVSLLASALTNVTPTRQQGQLNQGGGNIVKDIKQDISGGVKKGLDVVKRAGNAVGQGISNANQQAQENVSNSMNNSGGGGGNGAEGVDGGADSGGSNGGSQVADGAGKASQGAASSESKTSNSWKDGVINKEGASEENGGKAESGGTGRGVKIGGHRENSGKEGSSAKSIKIGSHRENSANRASTNDSDKAVDKAVEAPKEISSTTPPPAPENTSDKASADRSDAPKSSEDSAGNNNSENKATSDNISQDSASKETSTSNNDEAKVEAPKESPQSASTENKAEDKASRGSSVPEKKPASTWTKPTRPSTPRRPLNGDK